MKIRLVLRKLIKSSLFLLYPYLVYRGIQEGVTWFALIFIASLFLFQALKAKTAKLCFWNLDRVFLLVLGAVFYQDLMVKLIPIFIQISLMLFFGKTLLKERGPTLIERFASLDFPDIPPALSRYCRKFTIIWTAFFALNTIACIVLALFFPVVWWAFYTGVVIFLLTGLLMMTEYIMRHFYFLKFAPTLRQQIPGVKESVRSMIKNGKNIWVDVQG